MTEIPQIAVHKPLTDQREFSAKPSVHKNRGNENSLSCL
jgi:hypothetical protein